MELPGVELPGGELLACPWLPPPEDWLPWLLLEDELLDEELLDDELLLELLEDELLLEEGALVLGVDGVWGVVGLLAMGQPLRSRQAQAGSASLAIQGVPVLFNFISPDNFLGLHRLTGFQARPEPGFAQLAHHAVSPGPIDVLVIVDPLQVNHPAALGNPEF